ncbi:hypothetical protein, partial [Kitasatospora sp. NPDC093102]|uniref:hypothetical protein n=1 Tax=Kitasatospora sp. NPDC093102 TaxID=3155069 RepID=UPI00341FE1E3
MDPIPGSGVMGESGPVGGETEEPLPGGGLGDGFGGEEIVRAVGLLEEARLRLPPGTVFGEDPDVLAVAGVYRHALHTLLEGADAFPVDTDFHAVALAEAADRARDLAHARARGAGSGPDATAAMTDTVSGTVPLPPGPRGAEPPAHHTGDAGRPADTVMPASADAIAAGPVGEGLPTGGEAGAVTRFHRRIPDHPFTVHAGATTIHCHGLTIVIPPSKQGSFGEQDLTGVLRHTDGVWRVRFTTPDGGEF